MSAFKAANPDAIFEDFIRWHSPGDWENDDTQKNGSTKRMEDSNNDWPPRGRLSRRMSEHGNLWRTIWNDAPALPASEQKPLLDPNREGEKILHYLETLQPHQLLEEMVCTAFRASADTLNQTSYGGLKQMATKLEQLYITMASSLRPLQANRLSAGSEIIDDLRQLCGVLEHVEKLLTVASSLHRKFLQAPRLSEAIFSDYYNFYLPRMGTASVGDNAQMDFDKKIQVRIHERPVVSNMFTLPTANQSWRKVLSMGNLLNGHEPILREIIFSLRDKVSDHYAAHIPSVYQREIETYRMYICGTSNDLRVALSVVSCD
jgi:Rab3 GTPase-activating protein catalytic subunit